MDNLIETIADPRTWFLIILFVENIFIVKLYRYWAAGAGFSFWKMLCCILLSVFLFFLTIIAFAVFSSDSFRESKVDISPIAGLTSEQILRMEDVIERFEEFDFITKFNALGVRNDTNSYHIKWQGEDQKLLNISVSIYKNEIEAMELIQHVVRLMNESVRQQPYIRIRNSSNNTEALLAHSYMYRTFDTLYFPQTERTIRSYLRLGNTCIDLWETQDYYNLHKSISSEFIKLLCEMLQEEEITGE
jgi:hypothetical protein